MIKSGQKTAILKIDPIGDTMAEADETIIITINEGGDYGIASAYTMTATILNDDDEDYLNGGNVYQLTNNNIGNTAIVARTYHKSLLETNGKIVAPTDVAMKGAKSILMKPGFEVIAGGVFKATIEGCPPVASISTAEVTNPNVNNFRFVTINGEVPLSQSSVISAVEFEPNVLAAVDETKIYFEFQLEKDENVSIVLLNTYGGEVVKVLDNAAYKAGTFTAEIETVLLKKGDYFIKMLTKDKKTYQKVTVLWFFIHATPICRGRSMSIFLLFTYHFSFYSNAQLNIFLDFFSIGVYQSYTR